MVHQTIIPEERTITVSISVPESYVGQEVEVVAFIRDKDVAFNNLPVDCSYAQKENLMTNIDFINWVEQAEHMPTITLQEAKSKWESKKQQLRRIIK